MSRIVYALSGQGRGHTSRVMAITAGLRERGHEVLPCCGGTAYEILIAEGEEVLRVPHLKQVMNGNRLHVARTLRANGDAIRNRSRIVDRLATVFRECDIDLVITDFEAFAPRAAALVGLPVLSINHQEVVTETRYELPARYWIDAVTAQLAVRLIAPRRPRHVLIPSFFFPPLRNPEHATVIPPIIRPAVEVCTASSGEHVLVYCTGSRGTEALAELLGRLDAPFILYNVTPPDQPHYYPNLTFKEPSLDGFLADLASCRAVIATAGFTLISEALYLRKPALVLPVDACFEQCLNALYLQRENLGEAVIGRPLEVRDVSGFLSRADRYAERLEDCRAIGNEEALACIERFVGGPVRSPVVDGLRAPYVPFVRAIRPI